ncbi:MAG: GNAT family N-acetyltransferase [Clostridiales bacterium]|nr:GNAT family N-acetyltransferase [Clostridiales bacterium]
MKLTIKRASAEDAHIIGYIHSRTWIDQYKEIADAKIISQMTPERRAARIAQNISANLWEYYLIKLNGAPIGFLVLGASKEDDAASDTGEVAALCLAAEHQNRGYEARTLDFAVDKLLSYGFQTIYFWTDEGDISMHTLLSARDFSFKGYTRSKFIGTHIVHYRYERGPDRAAINDEDF